MTQRIILVESDQMDNRDFVIMTRLWLRALEAEKALAEST